MVCPQCKASMADNSLHCPSCGKYVGNLRPQSTTASITSPSVPPLVICPQCRAENRDNERHCKKCGGFLGATRTVNAQSQAPTSLIPPPDIVSQAVDAPSLSEGRIRCPYCDEDISANAKKCRWCGEWLDKSAQPSSSQPVPTPAPAPSLLTNTRPAVSIAEHSLWAQGNIETKPRKFLAVYISVGRGFKIWITLHDSTGHYTVSDGLLTIMLRDDPDPLNVPSKEILLLSDPKSKNRSTSPYKIHSYLFQPLIPIKRTIFEEVTYRDGKKAAGFYYNYSEPIYIDTEYHSAAVHAWFTTPDNTVLYKISNKVYWDQ
jgi:hypothetical protein